MTRRTASPAEHYTLTILALSVAALTLPWTNPLTALPAAAITYYAVIIGGAWALHWHIPNALTATNHLLRLYTAAVLRIAIATLTAAHHAIHPNPALNAA